MITNDTFRIAVWTPIAHVTGSKEPPDFDDCQASALCFELYCILFDTADALVSERKGITNCKWHLTCPSLDPLFQLNSSLKSRYLVECVLLIAAASITRSCRDSLKLKQNMYVTSSYRWIGLICIQLLHFRFLIADHGLNITVSPHCSAACYVHGLCRWIPGINPEPKL